VNCAIVIVQVKFDIPNQLSEVSLSVCQCKKPSQKINKYL
jgi:hypothetical protein